MSEGGSSRERLSLRLPQGVYARLEELRGITHASNANEVVKNALLFYDALVRERVKGSDVIVISPDGGRTKYPVFHDMGRDCLGEMSSRIAIQEAVAFLDRIEGAGYGGEAEFENARRGLKLALDGEG